jgi:Response regulator containing a CheY-like receiver domain and an HTH DNA-binding domain
VLDERAVRAVAQSVRGGSSADGGVEEPSEQEKRILALAAKGMTNRQIATALGVGAATVKPYFLVPGLRQARRCRLDVRRGRSDGARRNQRVTCGHGYRERRRAVKI